MQKRPLYRLLTLTAGILLGAMIAMSAASSPVWAAETEEMVKPAAHGDASAEPMPAGEHGASMTPAGEAAHAEGKAEDVGFPQLNAKSYPSQLFWLFVTFVLLYALMSKLALPKVGGVLEQRRELREGNLKRAEQLQDEASKAKSAYEAALAKAQESAQEAMVAVENDIAEKLAAENSRFTEQARKRIATAEQNIAKAKNDALASLADISAEISVEIVNKVAQVQVNKADAKKVVTDVMKKEAA